MNSGIDMALLKALLFDLDGTLVETESINAKSYANALNEFGVNVEANDILNTIRGRHWSYFLPVLTERKIANDVLAKIAARKQQIYSSLIEDVCVNKLLIELINSSASSYKIGLVTTASKVAVDLLLPKLGLIKEFDCIITGNDVEQRKPHPDAYFKTANLLNVLPEECLVFEDSEVGIQSALTFGAKVLQVHPF